MNYKEILNEWNNFLLTEASQMDFIRYMEEFFPDELEVFKSRKNEIGNLRDVYFNQIIINTLISEDQAHGPSELIDIYQEYSISIQPFINRSEEELVIVTNSGKVINLHTKFAGGHNNSTCTYDDIVIFLNAKLDSKDVSSKKTQTILEAEVEKSRNKSSEYFDFICEDENYIVFHPKTAFGSRIIARSVCVENKLIYDSSASTGRGKLTGKMTWCTSTASTRNQFNVYKEGNSHLYYCIKKYNSFEELMNDKGNEKRKCSFAFVKRIVSNDKIEIMFHTGGASVNGDNQRRDEQWFKDLLGNLYNLIYEDIRSDERKVFDLEGHYRAINSEIFMQNRNIAVDDPEVLGDFIREMRYILQYSHDKKNIAIICMNDEVKEIREAFANHSGLFSEDEEIVKAIFKNFNENEDDYINSQYLRILDYDLSNYPNILDYIERKSKENSPVAHQLTARNDLFKIDASGRLFEILIEGGFYEGNRSHMLSNLFEDAPDYIKAKYGHLRIALKFNNANTYDNLKEIIDEIDNLKETDLEKYELVIKTIKSVIQGTHNHTKATIIFSDSALKSIFYRRSLKRKKGVDFSKIPFDLNFEDDFDISSISAGSQEYNNVDEENYIPTKEDLSEIAYYYNFYQKMFSKQSSELSGFKTIQLLWDSNEYKNMSIISQVKITDENMKNYLLSNLEYFKNRLPLEDLFFSKEKYHRALDTLANFKIVYPSIEKIKNEYNSIDNQLVLDLYAELEKIKNSIQKIFKTDLNSISKMNIGSITNLGDSLYGTMQFEKANKILPRSLILSYIENCIKSKRLTGSHYTVDIVDLAELSRINLPKQFCLDIFEQSGSRRLSYARDMFKSKSFNTESFREIIDRMYSQKDIDDKFYKFFNLETIATNVKLYECFDDIEFIRKIVSSIKKPSLNQMCKVVLKIVETKDMSHEDKYYPSNRNIGSGPQFPESLDISDQGIKNFIRVIRSDNSLPIAKTTLRKLYNLQIENVSIDKESILERYIRNQLLSFI